MSSGYFSKSIIYPLNRNIEPIVVFMIFVFICFSIILFLAVLILRIRKTHFEKKIEILKSSLNSLLISAAFASTDHELIKIILRARPKFTEYIKNSRQAKVMSNEILTMHSNLSGESKNNLSQLFQATCLMTYTLKDLDNKNWYFKASAIKNLAQIDAEAYIPKIEKYAIDNNIYLQQVAQIALVNLKGYDGLDFLEKLNNKLSDWQQINIIYILRNLDKDNLPDFSQWLSHKEDSIKLFSIRLIHYFQQGYNSEKLEAFIHHKNKLLREEAINTLKEIRFEDHFAILNTVKA